MGSGPAIRGRGIVRGAVFWLVTGTAAGLMAGSGGVSTLPAPGTPPRSGLRMEVDTRWVDGNGYRPVRLRVYPLLGGNAPADRTLSVTLSPQGRRASVRFPSVSKVVELSQGSAVAEETIAVPCADVWGSIELSIYENGRRLEDLSTRLMRPPGHTYYQWTEASPAILLIDTDAPPLSPGGALRWSPQQATHLLPDFRALVAAIPLNHWGSLLNRNTLTATAAVNDGELLQLLSNLPRLEILPPGDLPREWIELSCIDIMFVSMSDLYELINEYPDQWRAVRSWLATGTTLGVYDVGEGFGQLAAVELAVGVPPLDAADAYRGWRPPPPDEFGKSAFDPRLFQSSNAVTVERNNRKRPRPTPPNEVPFLIRSADQGQLVAFAASDPFPGDSDLWTWFLLSLGGDHWMWYRRHGLSLQRENLSYWTLLIPGVGRAPVNSFLVFITLFAVVIGPVNYYWLRRWGRLYLLLVTVPLGATCVTGSLLLYALLTDGLGVRSRVRSLSAIDQRTKRVVAWSRQTYYAGLAPSQGLSFPVDAAVYPVDFRPQQAGASGRRRRMQWQTAQQLTAGFFPSRTTVQYFVVESRRTAAGLEFGEAFEDGRLPVTNHLGTTIASLVVCGPEGRFFATTSLADGESRELTESTASVEAVALRALLRRHRPEYPAGFNPYQVENAASFLQVVRVSPADNLLAAPSFDSSIFERRLQALVKNNLSSMLPRSYLASVQRDPHVSLGTAARGQASLQLVLGRW